MVGPYTGGPSANGGGGGGGGYPQRYDSPSYQNDKALPTPRQQNPAGYQLSDPQARSLPPAPSPYDRPPALTRPSEERQKSSTNGQRRPSGSRICGKCGEPLQGQFVRALDNTFHLDCFTCHVSPPKAMTRCG